MRNLIAVLVVASALCFSGAARAQVNYDLFPGYGGKQGYPPSVSYHAWVVSFKDSKFYACVATYKFNTPAPPTLVCRPGGTFNPPLLTGANVKTFHALGGPRTNDAEAESTFFWQIDQATGQIRFCMSGPGTNCVDFQIP